MRVSKLLWVLSLIVLVFTLFITTPGPALGADPWDELNAGSSDGNPDGGDGSVGTGVVVDPTGPENPEDPEDFLLMGTPGFWWELLFGDGDDGGLNSVEPIPTGSTDNTGTVTETLGK